MRRYCWEISELKRSLWYWKKILWTGKLFEQKKTYSLDQLWKLLEKLVDWKTILLKNNINNLRILIWNTNDTNQVYSLNLQDISWHYKTIKKTDTWLKYDIIINEQLELQLENCYFQFLEKKWVKNKQDSNSFFNIKKQVLSLLVSKEYFQININCWNIMFGWDYNPGLKNTFGIIVEKIDNDIVCTAIKKLLKNNRTILNHK